MKQLPRSLSFLFVAVFITALSFGIQHTFAADDFLKFHWKFDEGSGTNISDSSGNTPSYPGTLYGGPTWIPEGGLSFDGVNDYTRTNDPIPESMGVTNQAYTLSASVRIAPGELDGNIIHISDSPTGNGWCISMLHLDGGKFRAIGWQNGLPVTAVAPTAANTGEWYSISNTWSPETNELRLYVNGELVASTPMTFFEAADADVYVFAGIDGGSCSNSQGWFKGDVKDVRIYSRAITQEEAEDNSNESILETPYITNTTPADNSTGVALGADLSVTFNKSVELETGNIVIKKWQDDTIVATIPVDGGMVSGAGTATLTINPSSDFEYGTEYYVEIPDTAVSATADGLFFTGITDSTKWTFTTEVAPVSLATLTTDAATAITQTEATLNGTVVSTGGENVLPYGFYINKVPSAAGIYEYSFSDVSIPQSTGAFTFGGPDFECGTTYYYRAFGENSAGISYGDEKSFSTLACDGQQVPLVAKRVIGYMSQRPAQNTNISLAQPTPGQSDKKLCSADQLLTQNLKAGARNGKIHSFTKGVVTEVKILQSHMNRLGFKAGLEDGILGPITDGAIKRMQTYLGTRADGLVGPLTRALINNSCGSSAL